jgi:hypothetical protein
VGWLLDMNPTTVPDEEGKERSGLDLYFLQQDGETFKVSWMGGDGIVRGKGADVSAGRCIPCR